MVLAEDLRQAVLQAALQGKLTEQLETDSSVDEMLEDIQKDKEMRITNGEIKKDKRLTKFIVDEEDVPFIIPTNWKWTTLGSIVYKLTDGTHKTPKYTTNGIKFISVKNMSSGILDLSDTKYISQEEHDELYKRCNPEKGDMLLSKVGTTGVPAIVDTDEKFSLFVSVALLKYCHQFINESFLYYLLLSSLVQEQAKENTRGVGNKNWVLDFIVKTMIPLPPIEEQQRIVNKINEIMPKIDEYEKIEKELEALKKEFPTDMKDAILQAAMQGKLTEQLESDSSVDELLASIKIEKEELIAQKKIKKEKPLPNIEEVPFDIPENWRWARLKNICTKIVDGDHNPPRGILEKTEYLMLSAQNINSDKLVDLEQARYLTKEIFEQENIRTQVQTGDIFLTIVGTLGRSCIYTGGYNISFQRSVAVISTRIYNRYLKCVLDSPYIQQYMVKKATGTAQKGFYLNQIDSLLIPIPPFEEQGRIVERLDVLLPLCEDLKKE